ncbi:MAG: Fic family protein, partial [Anaerovoracaceae bacterium]
KDFKGREMIYFENIARISSKCAKILLAHGDGTDVCSSGAAEDEIFYSLEIENIDTSRESVRRILAGYAPQDASEERIYGMKLGMRFIADYQNEINEENLYKLYQMAVGNYLEQENRLQGGSFYRNDDVYVVGGKKTHKGLDSKLLPEYMRSLMDFINTESDIDDLAKAAVIHFYIAYIHPYFDGNGRIARLMQLWYLVQRGYPSAMLVSFSALIMESRKLYYKAYSLVEQNAEISGIVDATPFVLYFAQNVYNRIPEAMPSQYTMDEFANALLRGDVTKKEHDLWDYAKNHYNGRWFSTKELEKDYGKAAYGTIRTFVQKFDAMGLLECRNYSNRPKYRIR